MTILISFIKNALFPIFLVLVLVLSIFTNQAIAKRFNSQDRACASMFYSCQGKKKNTSICKQMKELIKDLKYSCNDIDLKKKTSNVMMCHHKGDEMVVVKKPNWLAVSWDVSNPKIFGYCDNPGAETARSCAVAQCKAKGGKHCKPSCDPGIGKRLRACRLGVQTYVASSDYGRFGCGTRHVLGGRWSVPGYAKRELLRCKGKTKTNDCMVMKTWNNLSP
jgi:hypothetical protein